MGEASGIALKEDIALTAWVKRKDALVLASDSLFVIHKICQTEDTACRANSKSKLERHNFSPLPQMNQNILFCFSLRGEMSFLL